ncbi:MAG: AAA family ATPase [Candidatus Hodarchaeota archaeon]
MKTIAILSHKGGVGKTYIAVNIAAYLAKKGKKVCLIDNDFHGPSIHTFFKPSVKWINNYLFGEEGIENSLQDFTEELLLIDESVIDQQKPLGRLFIGFADPSADSIRTVLRMSEKTSMRMLEKLLTLKKTLLSEPYHCDYLILDCPPGIGYSTINALIATDACLFIIKLSNADIVGTSNMITALYDSLKTKSLVIANFIPKDFLESEKAKEFHELVETFFTKNISDKVVDFLGWIPEDKTLLNTEFEQGLKTIRGQDSSRAIFTVNQPDHDFSMKIIETIPALFGETESQMFKDVHTPEEFYLKRLKIIVVGEPLVGKTALYHAISTGTVPERLQSTAGIDRYKLWEKQDGNTFLSAYWWDYAGQYAYRDIHRLFLTPDALYILVMNLRDSLEKNQAQYWLQSIREKAPKAKILPILTHYDQVNDNILGLTSAEDWQRLEVLISTYNTLEPIKVSNTEGTNINLVKTTINNLIRNSPRVPVPSFYLELETYISEYEEKIFLPIEALLKELDILFASKSDYSKDNLIKTLTYLSTRGLFHIVDLPSAPIIVIFDIDRVNKVISLIIDQAKLLKGYIQEVDILDVCADFFIRKNRREAAKIIAQLIVSIDLALVIPERSSSGRKTDSWFIPHASEIISEEQAAERYPSPFQHLETKIGQDLAYFHYKIFSLDNILPARILGHLINYIPYSEYNRIWRECTKNSEIPTILKAILYENNVPIIHYRTKSLSKGEIKIELYVTEDSLEKGLFSSLSYALGKFGASFKIADVQFIKTKLYSAQNDNFHERLNRLSEIPPDYLKSIRQALEIFNSAPSSTIITATAALEKLFTHLYTKRIGKPDPVMKFWEIIKGLEEANVIPRTVRIWADTVRLHRNNCAHNINPVSTNDVIVVLEEILYILEWYNTLLLKGHN